jgi:hypothetical protein
VKATTPNSPKPISASQIHDIYRERKIGTASPVPHKAEGQVPASEIYRRRTNSAMRMHNA